MRTQPAGIFRKTAEAFVAGAKSLPQKYFVSSDIFAEEQRRIFSRHWTLVGHQSAIAKPGDFLVAEISGESIIVVRDKDEIRAFYNVCRHRGARLCEPQADEGETSGHFSAIQCPYHAWTYSFEGELLGAPNMDAVPGFNKSDYPLVSTNVGTWEGFIFVNLANGDPTRLHSEATARQGSANFSSLEYWFLPLTGKFANWKMLTLRPAKRICYDVHANWKLIFENYSECYHCAGVHPELTRLSPADSAENDLSEGPFLGGFMKINRGRSLTKSGNACALTITDCGEIRDDRAGRDRLPAHKKSDCDHAHEQEGLNRVWYYSIFPNMLLSLHPDYVMVHRLSPVSSDRTLIACEWYFHPDAFGRDEFNPQDAIDFWDTVNRQDWHVCELSQQGISSRVYEPGPYSSRECIPAAWDREYLRQLSH